MGDKKQKLFELGNPNDKKYQFRIYDDHTFDILSLETDGGLLIEKKDGEPVAAFEHRYNNEYYFPGYKDLQPGMITPGFNRDTLLELHPLLSDTEKPKEKVAILGPDTYVNNIAKNRAKMLRAVPKVSWQFDKITLGEFWVSIILALCVGLRVIL
jgi:hypothetical protein